ncbi:hypothetical protein OsJ_31555 [Oryza sativa Japonica Group]|uniref:Uncharacterized protein n=1 Tax=Oryza sativa subsp. japonica TaxID=39947 RepID=B9G5S7_ORYSJ|nr:hypothetical protein OsJ_31555 [Oryza sativa Japonica Group]
MTAGGSIDQKLETFLREVEAADDEMEALCDELSCLLVSAYRLRVWLAPMDRHAPALVSAATTAGMRSRLLGSARCLWRAAGAHGPRSDLTTMETMTEYEKKKEC